MDCGIGAGISGGNCGVCMLAGSGYTSGPVQVFIFGALASTPQLQLSATPAPPPAYYFPGALGTLNSLPIWREVDQTSKVWYLVAAGFGNDQSLCGSTTAVQLFSSAIGESSLYSGGANVTALAIHRLMYSYSQFNAMRVSVINPTSSPQGMAAGRTDLIFTFGGSNTARDLMFTTQTYLASGPSWNQWKVAFGYGRQGGPWFSRGGSSANSALPSGGFSGACPCSGLSGGVSGTGPAFGYATNDGTCMVDTGIGVICSHCAFAQGGDMSFSAQLVLIYAGTV